MVVKNDHVFVGTFDGLFHFQLDEKGITTPLGQFGEKGRVFVTKIVGNYLYVITRIKQDTEEEKVILNVWDIANLLKPTLLTTVDLPGNAVTGIDVYKSWLFISGWNYGMTVIDISRPGQAKVVGKLLQNIIVNTRQKPIVQNDSLILSDNGQLKSYKINEAPQITTDSLQTTKNTVLTQQLEFINLEQDSLTFLITTAATNGQVSVNNSGELTYQPNNNFSGIDSFKVKVVDQYGGDSEQLITVEVNDSGLNPLAQEIQNGERVKLIASASEKVFAVFVPEDAAKVKFIMSKGKGEADMYIRRSVPATVLNGTVTEYDEANIKDGKKEKVIIRNPQGGAYYYVTLKARAGDFSKVQLIATVK